MSFNEMNISAEIKSAIDDMGFENPTPIQAKVIPLVLDGHDVLAQAPTGTGKTCAFGIPIVNNVDTESENIQALILCPTRELVIQTENELKEVSKHSKDIRIVSIYGGQNFDRQLAGLRKRPQIVVGTTGRVMDHLRRKSLKLQNTKILILDEVDEMLDMGFREDIDVILQSLPKERQTVLFSATMPKEIIEVSKLYQKEPVSVKTQHEESDIPNINQYYVKVNEGEKIAALVSIMREKTYKLALVFCNTKKRVDELSAHINNLGINADALHGDLRQHQRDKTMKRFRSEDIQMLIATDVAARGLDVDNVEAVFNFDIPHDEEYYVHRIGRTSRAMRIGDAYTFASDKQMYAIKNFENYTKTPIIKTDYSKETANKTIDKKLFYKTLKIIKSQDLSAYKEFLSAEFEAFEQRHDGAEMLDVAAALLLQLNQIAEEKSSTLSDLPRETKRQKESARRASRGGVRFFMNIGTRDKCDELAITKLISSKSGVPTEHILSVNLLENYSFANVSEGFNDAMESLNGLRFNKRILAVEVAESGGKSRKQDGGKEKTAKREETKRGGKQNSDRSKITRGFEDNAPFKKYRKDAQNGGRAGNGRQEKDPFDKTDGRSSKRDYGFEPKFKDKDRKPEKTQSSDKSKRSKR